MERSDHIYTPNVRADHVVSCQKNDGYALHCHTFYEIYYFVSGDIRYLIEGVEYQPAPHSILLMAPNVFHGVKIETDSPYERYTLHFMPEMVSPENRALFFSLFHAEQAQGGIYYQSVNQFEISEYFKQVLQVGTLPQDICFSVLSIRIQSLLSQILVMSRLACPAVSQNQIPQVIPTVIQYLNEHLTDNITLDDLSGLFFISKHHLNKLFRKATGTTVMDYLIHKRIAFAQQLMTQGESAGRAALRSGFHDYSVFYRAYKRILGYSPSEYQRLPNLQL